MSSRTAGSLAWAAATGTAIALAQQPAPVPAPNFAAPNLTAQGARSMAAGCAMCHGTQGRVAPGSTVPGLAGRAKDEIVQAMAAFKSGARPATVMHQIAKGFGDDEVAAIAEFFAGQSR